jgi:ATP-dependent DNA helicase RecQ
MDNKTARQQRLQQILQQYFGYSQFRQQQQQAINAVLDGKDVLVLMPTGGGKSLCYQVPALYLPGITLVISPLIALMHDQVEALKANGVEAAYLNSTQNWQEQSEIERKAGSGKLKLLYVSPEKLLSSQFQSLLKTLTVTLLAVDEAHCVSFWGHDFRPEYTQLATIKQLLPGVPTIALTATADSLTRKDIVEQLKLQQPKVLIASFDRPNLSLTVLPAQKRVQVIKDFLGERPFQPGIVYCLSRRSCETLAERLAEAGYKAKPYHAALSAAERRTTQEAFLKDDIQVVCATIAFGMGIDKSNVRWVIHYNLPKNIESYYQEIGRAGRDGEPADTLLFYSFGDVIKQRGMLEDLTDERRKLQEAKLERLQQYAEAQFCRRRILLAYFGEVLEEGCGNCDVCAQPRTEMDGTVLAQKALSAVVRAKEELGLSLLIDVLRGADTDEIRQKGLFKIKTYGAGKTTSVADWRNYLVQIINSGLLDVAYDQKAKLKLNERSKAVLFEGKPVGLYKAEEPPALKAKPKTTQEYDPQLFEQLRSLRKMLAEQSGVPPYVIFSDKSLREMAEQQPLTEPAMLRINGVGRQKWECYGQDFINEILKYRSQQKLTQEAKEGSTHLVTLRLLTEGHSPDQVAEQRNVKVETIYSHIAALYEQRKIESLRPWLPAAIVSTVKVVVDAQEGESGLKPIYDSLGGAVPYWQIRLSLSELAKI